MIELIGNLPHVKNICPLSEDRCLKLSFNRDQEPNPLPALATQSDTGSPFMRSHNADKVAALYGTTWNLGWHELLEARKTTIIWTLCLDLGRGHIPDFLPPYINYFIPSTIEAIDIILRGCALPDCTAWLEKENVATSDVENRYSNRGWNCFCISLASKTLPTKNDCLGSALWTENLFSPHLYQIREYSS